MSGLRRYLNTVFEDKLFWGIMALFCIAIVLMALFVPVSEDTEETTNPESIRYADGWNAQTLKPANNQESEAAEAIYQIKRVFHTEAAFPKGLKIKWARVQDTRVLVIFEQYKDLNRSYNRDYIAVYDVSGAWLYGFEGVLPYESTRIALMPNQEGVLFWEWKMKSTEKELFLLVTPDGHKQMHVTEDLWSDMPAYWNSDYTVAQTKESRLVIVHTDTGKHSVVFDYSDAYPTMYPRSSKIDEEQEMMLNGLVPIFFMLIIIFLLPWMMDNPNIPKRGMKEVHGDLRDRH